jgi:hypothetical protein
MQLQPFVADDGEGGGLKKIIPIPEISMLAYNGAVLWFKKKCR